MICRNFSGILLLHTVLFIYINLSSGSKNVPCTSDGICKCEFPNGMGIDLISLKGSHFNISAGNGEWLHFNPCNNTNITVANATTNECEPGASLCLEKHIGNVTKLFNLGFVNESHFEWENIMILPVINFKHLNRTVRISLECAYSKPTSLEIVSMVNEHMFELKLTTESACVRTVTNEGHSVFSTFLLIALILFFVYFLCGFLVLRFIKGARGWESIPHGEFWRSSWTSIKNTCSYAMNGCKSPEAYDTI